jgi:hypothetical protein
MFIFKLVSKAHSESCQQKHKLLHDSPLCTFFKTPVLEMNSTSSLKNFLAQGVRPRMAVKYNTPTTKNCSIPDSGKLKDGLSDSTMVQWNDRVPVTAVVPGWTHYSCDKEGNSL